MMDWNIRPSPDSSLQAKNVEFQGSHLEQHFPAASGFSQDHASTQKPYIYPGNNQIINISSSAIIADKMPLQNTGSSSALQPILPKLSKANKGFGPSKHLHNIPPVSLSAMFVQMTSGVTQNSNMRNVPSSSHVVLQDGTVNPVQNIPQKRANPYMAMENYNNQSQQINSNYVRMSVYQSPRNQPTVPPYFYVSGPSISQAGATVPLNSSSSHYLNSQQNFSCTVLPIGQNSQNQINDQNPSMTATVQSQQYASDVNNIPYNMPTHCDKRNAIQISSYALPIQVTDKPPPPYQAPSVQTNYGQFSLPQPVANISNENVQNYHSPMPDQNTASYSAHCVQERQPVQITRETNAVGSIAYNVSEHGSGNQLSNESTKSSFEFRDSFLSSVQASTIAPADEALTPQASQTLGPQNKPSNVLVNFPDNPSKVKLKITKESLARDYKKINAVERVLLKLGEAYKVKRKIFLSTQENKQASDPSDHSQNLSQSSCNIAQNEPSSVANPALQFPSQDANKNQSSLPASYDSNQIKAIPLLPQKTGSHLLPILRNLLEGTDDENMLLNAFFEKEVTHQNGQLAVDGSSSRNLSVTNGDKSEYSVNNTVSTSRLKPQISQMNLTQEPLSCIKNDVGLMQTSRTTSHQLEKVTAASGKGSFHHFKLDKGALETLRHFISCRLENLIQNPEKGRIENIHDSQSVSPISVQKHEKNIKTGDEHVYDASSPASLHSKRVAVVQETGSVQNPTISADSFRNGGTCSLEELKTSLDLWRKSLPASLNGQLHENTQSTGNLSSSEYGDTDKKMQQSLENPTNTFIQNNQVKFTSGSDETTQSSVPLSLGRSHDVVSSNLSKGSEPQVAIVTPLMLPKENIQIVLHKNSPSLEITCPRSEEGKVHSLQKFLSTLAQNDKEIQDTTCLPRESVKYSKDYLEINQKVLSTQENRKDEVEPGNRYSQELRQVVDNHSSLELKTLKSQLDSGDNCPPDKKVSKKCVQSQTGPNLVESRDTDEVVQNDAMLQISSVCTLVKGDAFYNSQIANIFSTSPLIPSMENNTSLKDSIPCLQSDDQQCVILQTKSEPEMSISVSEGNALLPSPYTLSKADEEIFKGSPDLEMSQSHKTSNDMNERNSEEGKNSLLPEGMSFPEKKLEQNVSCSGVHCTDLMSNNQELCQNIEDRFGSSTGDGLCVNKEEEAAECVSAEENQKHSGSSTEAPVTLLSDQLSELSKEFPYGIGYLKSLNITGNNDPMPKLNNRGNTENVQISGKCHDSSGAIDQIKIMILNSEQMKEVFPECKQQFSNKSENSEDDCLKTDSGANLTGQNTRPVTTDKALAVEATEISSEKSFKREVPTYCCTKAWIATGYVTGPCQCALLKESSSKKEVDLCSQSKPSDGCNVDFNLNSQLPTSTLNTVTKKVSSGTQTFRTLNKISGPTGATECKPQRVDQAVSPLPSLEKLNLQNNKHTRKKVSHHASSQPSLEKLNLQNNKHTRKEVSHHASSQPLKIEVETIESNMTRDTIYARGNSSTDEAQCLSNTEDVAVAKKFCRNEQRTKVVLKSKVDTFRHRRIEIKHSTNYERYKIKRDSSETHMIKGPTLNKSLKRQKAMERKRKALAIQHNNAISASNLNSVGSFSQTCENPQYSSTSHSQEHLNGKKFVNIRDLEKHYGYKKVEHKRTYSELNEQQSEGTEHTKPIKRINLEKYAYSKDRKNAWKYRSSHLDNGKTLTPQKQRGHPPNRSKMCSPAKEAVLDANKREKRSERSLSDMKSCFNRRTSKLSMFLQREPKKTYLNRVAFRRTAQKTICLTSLEPSHSKSVWHVKSSSLSGLSKEKRKSSLPPQQPETEKPQMLQFKMCPDILFRNPVTEEQILNAAELPEKDRAPVAAVKSKREDWLNYAPVKRRKTEEDEAQVDDDIPLDTAIKLLDRNETFGMPLKDSQTTFETYRKMHLEKRSRSLDSNLSN